MHVFTARNRASSTKNVNDISDSEYNTNNSDYYKEMKSNSITNGPTNPSSRRSLVGAVPVMGPRGSVTMVPAIASVASRNNAPVASGIYIYICVYVCI